MKFGNGDISADEADLAAFRYISKKSFWDLFRFGYVSLSQVANGYVIGRNSVQKDV